MNQCRAVKINGLRCEYKAKEGYGGFCGHHFPKTDTNIVSAESKVAKFQKYVAIGSGLAAIIKVVLDAIHQVSSTNRPGVYALSYASTAPTIYETAEDLLSRAADENNNVEELEVDAVMLNKEFDSWFSELPGAVQSAIYEYLEKEQVAADAKALDEKLFYAVMNDFDERDSGNNLYK